MSKKATWNPHEVLSQEHLHLMEDKQLAKSQREPHSDNQMWLWPWYYLGVTSCWSLSGRRAHKVAHVCLKWTPRGCLRRRMKRRVVHWIEASTEHHQRWLPSLQHNLPFCRSVDDTELCRCWRNPCWGDSIIAAQWMVEVARSFEGNRYGQVLVSKDYLLYNLWNQSPWLATLSDSSYMTMGNPSIY